MREEPSRPVRISGKTMRGAIGSDGRIRSDSKNKCKDNKSRTKR